MLVHRVLSGPQERGWILLFLLFEVSDLGLELFNLVFVFFNDFLTEMRPLGEFFLHFDMVSEVPLERLDDPCHLMVLVHEVFGLFRLVI